MNELPTGTVTFLFTDIEGSTRLWEEHRDEMQIALSRHDLLLRKAIESHGGYVFSTAGDAFAASFARVGDALEAAVAAQVSLAAEPWPTPVPVRVRIGLHVGEAQERDGDYFGPSVNRAARIMSAAHGRQVLVSGPVAALAPPAVELVELGRFRLKDLMAPELISQVEVPGVSNEFPPIRSPDTAPGNVPASISSFVGRIAETAEVRRLLDESRLVTIVGAPGAGKTRLAYQVAKSMHERFPDGVWCIELAPLRDGGLIGTELIGTLGLTTPATMTPVEALCHQLADWQALLVIDNCEHLLADTAQLINRLLRAATSVSVLATSRHPLDIAGETTWRLPPLGPPTAGEEATFDSSDSSRLFAERAKAVRPGIDLAAEQGHISDICRRLDGLPLAIELASTRLRSMTLAELADRLGDRFQLLSRGDPTDIEHHQTLQALVDWSYDLLDPSEQEIYRSLSVFQGGWVASAAESVGASGQIAPLDVVDLVDGLVSNSLAIWDASGDRPRFRMLETMRQHAEALLTETGEMSGARDRHLAWILTLTTEAGTELDGPDQQFWIATLNTELDNIRGAYDWGLSGGDAATALKAASQIPRYWWLTSQIAEGAEWLERLLRTAVDAPQAVRARGLSGSGFLINMLGRPREAEARLREAVALLREGDDGVALAWALNFLGRAAWDSEDATTLRRYQQEAAELFADNGIGQGVFLARIMETAVVAFLEQDAPTSVEMSKQLIVMAEQVGAPNALAHAHESVAWAGSHAEQAPDALAAYRKALPFYRDLGNRDCACHCLSGVAHSLALTGRTRDAAELIGVVDALLESLSVVPPGYERVLYYRAREALGNSEPQARRQGRNVEFDTAIDLALELIG